MAERSKRMSDGRSGRASARPSSDRQRDTYLHAGAAAYVPMTPGTPDLLDAVTAAAACLQPLLAD